MTKAANDNEPLSFLTIQAATRNVLRYLFEEEKNPEKQERSPNHHPGNGEQAKPDEEREYIEHRLRELAAWERRISGKR